MTTTTTTTTTMRRRVRRLRDRADRGSSSSAALERRHKKNKTVKAAMVRRDARLDMCSVKIVVPDDGGCCADCAVCGIAGTVFSVGGLTASDDVVGVALPRALRRLGVVPRLLPPGEDMRRRRAQ
jgi:hypothetical protein